MCFEGTKDDKPPPNGTGAMRLGSGKQCEDMTLANFRHAVDLFFAYPQTEGTAAVEEKARVA